MFHCNAGLCLCHDITVIWRKESKIRVGANLNKLGSFHTTDVATIILINKI